MNHTTAIPHPFEYHQYLKKILAAEQASSLFIATEADFQRGEKLTYPYRSYFYALGLLHEDNCRIRIGFRDFAMNRQALTIVGPGIARLWLENDWKAKNSTIFFTPELFPPPFDRNFLLKYDYFQPGAHHVLDLADEQYQQAVQFIQLLQQYVGQQPVAAGILFAFLEFIARIYPAFVQNRTGANPHHTIVQKFTWLLHLHFQAQKSVGFYAEQLNLSAKYLSDLLKKETGKPAKQLIDDFILFEAKSLLKQTDMSIKEIVYWLGYEDPTYFSKLFKEKVGVAPLQYRT